MDVEVSKIKQKLARAKSEVSELNAKLLQAQRRKRDKDRSKAGMSLEICQFGLDREELHVGCMLYAMKAIRENPQLEEELRAAGVACLEEAKGNSKKGG